jgi:hypothetical protein
MIGWTALAVGAGVAVLIVADLLDALRARRADRLRRHGVEGPL